MAETKKDAVDAVEAFVETYQVKYKRAADCLIRLHPDFATADDFRSHLRVWAAFFCGAPSCLARRRLLWCVQRPGLAKLDLSDLTNIIMPATKRRNGFSFVYLLRKRFALAFARRYQGIRSEDTDALPPLAIRAKLEACNCFRLFFDHPPVLGGRAITLGDQQRAAHDRFPRRPHVAIVPLRRLGRCRLGSPMRMMVSSKPNSLCELDAVGGAQCTPRIVGVIGRRPRRAAALPA